MKLAHAARHLLHHRTGKRNYRQVKEYINTHLSNIFRCAQDHPFGNLKLEVGLLESNLQKPQKVEWVNGVRKRRQRTVWFLKTLRGNTTNVTWHTDDPLKRRVENTTS